MKVVMNALLQLAIAVPHFPRYLARNSPSRRFRSSSPSNLPSAARRFSSRISYSYRSTYPARVASRTSRFPSSSARNSLSSCLTLRSAASCASTSALAGTVINTL